jgi:D-aspartate ligase
MNYGKCVLNSRHVGLDGYPRAGFRNLNLMIKTQEGNEDCLGQRNNMNFLNNVHDVLKHDELCIVLGLGTQTGLSVLRCLGEQGIKVLGFDQLRFPMGRYSRYCDSFIRYSSHTHLHSILMNLGAMHIRKLPIIVSSDTLALFVDEHRDSLSEHYFFNWQKNQSLGNIINKHNMNRLAQEAVIDTPRTWYSDEISLEQFSKEIVFPSFIKPLYTKGRKKGFIIHSLQEFEDTLGLDLFRNGFIVQEFIEGPETNIIVVQTYSDINGKMIAACCGRKVRQLPRDKGISTYIRACNDEQATLQAEIFISHVGYYGIADIEFKKSIIDGRHKFIEINPRVSGFNAFPMAQGVNLPYICYLDLLGRLDEWSVNGEKSETMSWISFLDDVHTFFRFYFPDNPRLIVEWLKNVARADVDAVFSMKDPLPFIIALSENFMKILGRLKEEVLR